MPKFALPTPEEELKIEELLKLEDCSIATPFSVPVGRGSRIQEEEAWNAFVECFISDAFDVPDQLFHVYCSVVGFIRRFDCRCRSIASKIAAVSNWLQGMLVFLALVVSTLPTRDIPAPIVYPVAEGDYDFGLPVMVPQPIQPVEPRVTATILQEMLVLPKPEPVCTLKDAPFVKPVDFFAWWRVPNVLEVVNGPVSGFFHVWDMKHFRDNLEIIQHPTIHDFFDEFFIMRPGTVAVTARADLYTATDRRDPYKCYKWRNFKRNGYKSFAADTGMVYCTLADQSTEYRMRRLVLKIRPPPGRVYYGTLRNHTCSQYNVVYAPGTVDGEIDRVLYKDACATGHRHTCDFDHVTRTSSPPYEP